MWKFIKDITTGRDNQTHDVVRSSMAVIIFMLPFVMIWGLAMTTWAFVVGKPFDLHGSFDAVLAFLTGAGAFLVGGGASLFLKNKTEPDGTVTKVESIQTGQTPATVVKNTTVVEP